MISFKLLVAVKHGGAVPTCMIIIIDGHCGCVVVAQHGFGGRAGVQGGSADLGITNHSRVTEVDVEILIFLKDVIINNTNCDL